MEGLGRSRLLAVSASLARLHRLRPVDAFWRCALGEVLSLVPGRCASMHVVDVERRRVKSWHHPSSCADTGALVLEHPALRRLVSSRRTRVVSLSDLGSAAWPNQLLATYRRLGLKDAIAIRLEDHGPALYALIVARETRGFSETDRAVLWLLRPHLLIALGNMHLFEQLRRRPFPTGVPPLSAREAEVLAWAAEGKTNREIAAILAIKGRTVATHFERIFAKLDVSTRSAAVARLMDDSTLGGGSPRTRSSRP